MQSLMLPSIIVATGNCASRFKAVVDNSKANNNIILYNIVIVILYNECGHWNFLNFLSAYAKIYHISKTTFF